MTATRETLREAVKRRHTCPHCGQGYVTVEMTVAEAVELAKPKVEIRTVTKIRSSKLTRRARLFLQRGVDVPPTMENDWKTLRGSGMSSAEAAASLGLPYLGREERQCAT